MKDPEGDHDDGNNGKKIFMRHYQTGVLKVLHQRALLTDGELAELMRIQEESCKF